VAVPGIHPVPISFGALWAAAAAKKKLTAVTNARVEAGLIHRFKCVSFPMTW
jgi:hypothetical protein